MKTTTTEIERFSPCIDAVKFRRQYPDFKTAWDNCPRGDWMLWIAARLEIDNRILTLAKGKCAETVIHLMKDERSRKAVQAAIDYGNGIIDDKELKDAAYAALAALATLAADAASSAADAADAASSAADAADAAAYAADAADAAAYAADAASAAYEKNRLQTADICREILTDEVMEKIRENSNNSN